MRRWLLILALGILLPSCHHLERSRTKALESMEAPIVVFAESQTAIILIDKNDKKLWFENTDRIGTALIESYNLGDTLISLKHE